MRGVKLCKANATRVLHKAGFKEAKSSHGGTAGQHGFEVSSWSDLGTSVGYHSFAWGGDQALRESQLAAMTCALSVHWKVTSVDGRLQLSEKEDAP